MLVAHSRPPDAQILLAADSKALDGNLDEVADQRARFNRAAAGPVGHCIKLGPAHAGAKER